MPRKKKTEIAKQKELILQFFKSADKRPYTLSDLYNEFDVYDQDDRVFFRLIIEELEDEQKLHSAGRHKYIYNSAPAIPNITGVLDLVNPRFGFVRYEDGAKDIYVESNNLNGALDGDTVTVSVSNKQSKGGNPEGRILEILKRGRTEVVGQIKLYPNYAIVKPDNRKFHEDIFIAQANIGDAQTGDLVVVKILEFPTDYQQATGKVVEVLGKSGENDAEMHAIMVEFGLPIKFPKEVEEQANAIPNEISQAEIDKRRDFREVLTFTIDPADAKDFDDAISFKKIDDLKFEVGVHIADVTHYVKPGTVLEEEAFKRATSVYLVDRTIPMLPEHLSNGLCSLRPNEDKLVFSAVFEIDLNGKVLSEWFGRSIIHSDRRFAYEEAQEVLEEKNEFEITEDLKYSLLTLNKIAKNLKEDRFKKGAFNFETQEVKFFLDENGKPTGIFQKERKDAHKLIEEFMLLANKRVAEFVFHEKFRKKKTKNAEESPTMVYRVHEPPNPEKLVTFSAFAGKLGFTINSSSQQALSNSLNGLMAQIAGTPIQNVLESLAVRTMSKARYSTAPMGHFGLAFEHYSHFTSPIRRYPDMMAHRMLQHYLDNGKNLEVEAYEGKCKHSSDQEKLAAEAERASIKYKQVEYMSYQDSQVEYPGVVTGVTDFGIFVEMDGTGCEGMVRLADMNDDFYDYDADNYRLIGKRKGRIITFGDQVKVKLKSTDLSKRSIELELTEVSGKSILTKSQGNDRRNHSKPQQKNKRSDRKVIPPKKGRRR